jgi:hypothetical protein
VKPTPSRARSKRSLSQAADPAVRAAVIAHAAVQATSDQLPALRQNPGPMPGPTLPPSFLKHADEQTVVAMAALFQAIDRHGLAGTCFTDWGVLAAPRYLGRITTVQALQRFAAEGAWGISPHLIPHRTLHAISGTISQALQIHGPNLGVGGGPDADVEVMRVAAAFLTNQDLPGVWVVMTGWNPEPVLPTPPGPDGHSPPSTNGYHAIPVCQAVALALTPLSRTWDGLQLEFHLGVSGSNGHPSPPLFNLESFQAALGGHSISGHSWSLGNGGLVDLGLAGIGAEMKL